MSWQITHRYNERRWRIKKNAGARSKLGNCNSESDDLEGLRDAENKTKGQTLTPPDLLQSM